MKSKFSISVDAELCAWLDAGIASKKFASRSHGVEYALNELAKQDRAAE